MKTTEVNNKIIGRRCKCIFTGLLVTGVIEAVEENEYVKTWGGCSLKGWIDSYESTRFTPIGADKAVITSEYNMDCVKEWLEHNTPVKDIVTC